MADQRKGGIGWTEETWNPVTGCDKISAGCDHCYAYTLAERFRGVPGNYFEQGFDIVLRPHKLQDPVRWQRPRMIFVNSMSDLFHKDIPQAYLDQVFDVMEAAPQHIFQVLTKRSSLMVKYLHRRWMGRKPPAHIWLGVSVENQQATSRLAHLIETPAAVRFASLEPLLGPVDLGLFLMRPGLGWVIVGGESGAGHRPMDPDWARSLRDQCNAAGVPYYFKQWGGPTSKAGGKLLDGAEWCQMPEGVAA